MPSVASRETKTRNGTGGAGPKEVHPMAQARAAPKEEPPPIKTSR